MREALLRLPENLSKAGCSRKRRDSEAAAHGMNTCLDESKETWFMFVYVCTLNLFTV